MNKTLYWLPRVFGIMFAAVVTLFVFDIDPFSWLALLIHLLPTIVILIALIIAWKKEKIGGIIFFILGLAYIVMAWGDVHWLAFLVISGPAFLTGILFLLPKPAEGMSAPVNSVQDTTSVTDSQFQNEPVDNSSESAENQ